MQKERIDKLYMEYISVRNAIRAEFLSFYQEAGKVIDFMQNPDVFILISITNENGDARLYRIECVKYAKELEDVLVKTDEGLVFYMDDLDAESMCYLMKSSLPLL